jgi:hypothetical protein
MYPSTQLMPTRASGGRSVAALAASALVVSLVSLQLAVIPRATAPAAPSHGDRTAPGLPVAADRLGIVFRGR